MKWIKAVLGIVIFLFAIHFSIQNRDLVPLRYSIQDYQWFEVTQVPLFLVILCSILLGVLIGGIGDLRSRLRLKKNIRQNQKNDRAVGKGGSISPWSSFRSTLFLKKEED